MKKIIAVLALLVFGGGIIAAVTVVLPYYTGGWVAVGFVWGALTFIISTIVLTAWAMDVLSG